MHATSAANYAKAARDGRAPKPFALLYGPAGCGKTTLAMCVAETLGMELVESNSSEERNVSSIRSAANAAMNGTAVLFDEADGMGKREQKLLARLAEKFNAPAFLTANDEGKLVRELRDSCLEIHVPRPSRARLREVGRAIKATPRTIVSAASFRDLIHGSGGTVGEMTQREVMGALLGGDAEAGKTSDVMRAEPWILDNTVYKDRPLRFDQQRSRYRHVGSSFEKYARFEAARSRIPEPRFPWSLGLKGHAKRQRAKAERQRRGARDEEEKEENEAVAEALKEAQKGAAHKSEVEAVDEWI